MTTIEGEDWTTYERGCACEEMLRITAPLHPRRRRPVPGPVTAIMDSGSVKAAETVGGINGALVAA
jgi:hypothetical protein